ncbi:peptidyl-tRNA hydrolase PTH2-domain-containing protein [Geopyxis carbonaria]|nr:peptidyl-tRNA hydrolase PTH2-domain-containing protein [Geopyxis carbonaria]
MATTSLALTVIAAVTGYYIGKTSGLRASDTISSLRETAKTTPTTDDEFTTDADVSATDAEWDDAEDDDDDDDDEGVKADFSGVEDEDCKMVLVVRTDLGMTKGKIAAQCGHATLMCYKAALRAAPALVRRWEQRGVAKIALQAGSEEELLVMQAQALSLGIVAKIVHDAGRTQIASGSATVLGLGPAPRSVVDAVSGGLKLL